ncbi:unnamed protein product [Amoebophrya sp. A25]|nr:unnamed protein product [Amoebophrya sp. A25]|eukprot:GSA25T00011713001.1
MNPKPDRLSFFPEFALLPPKGKKEIFVALRAGGEERIDELARVLAYGAPTTGNLFMQVLASVQVPKVVCNKSHFHFPITYTGKISDDKFVLKMRNIAGLAAPLRWRLPEKDVAPLFVTLTPMVDGVPIAPAGDESGDETLALKPDFSSYMDVIRPESAIELEVRVTPQVQLRARESRETRVDVMVEIAGVPLPLRITVTAVVFGLEVDYLVRSPEEEQPFPDIPYLRLPRSILTEKQLRSTHCHPVFKELVELPAGTFGGRSQGIGTRSQTATRTATLSTSLKTRSGTASAARSASGASGSALTSSSSARRRQEQFNSGPTLDSKALDFGQMPLLAKRHLRLILYNRTGIPANWTAHMGKYKAYVPPSSPKKKILSLAGGTGAGSLTDSPTAAPMDASAAASTFSAQPQGKLILDDKHESQVFSSAMGIEYAQQKLSKEAGSLNLKYGLGFAVALEPSQGRLEGFGVQVIDCYCYSDLPGTMTDHVHIRIGSLPEFLVDAKVVSVGNPLYLVPLQIGLNLNEEPEEQRESEYPELSFGTLVLADRTTRRRLRLGNLSSANIDVEWRFVKQKMLEDPDNRAGLSAMVLADEEAAGGKDDCRWTVMGVDPDPEVHEPFSIMPKRFTVKKHSVADFQTKLRTDHVGKYHYKLVGVGRYSKTPSTAPSSSSEVEGLGATTGVAADTEELVLPLKPPKNEETAMVEQLPELELENLADSDSDNSEQALDDMTSNAAKTATSLFEEEDKPRARILVGDSAASSSTSRGQRKKPKKKEIPQSFVQQVVSTVSVECNGECVIPTLHLDKKLNPSYAEPVVKFFYQTLNPIPNLHTKNRVGAIVVGGGNLDPAPGIALGLIRKVSFTQEIPSFVHCRFRIAQGRFRILKLELPGRQAILGPFLTKQQETDDHFKVCLKPRDVATLLIEFVPPKTWENASSKSYGELYIEYPTEQQDTGRQDAEEQLVGLVQASVTSSGGSLTGSSGTGGSTAKQSWQRATSAVKYPFHPPQIVRLEGVAKKPDLRLEIIPLVATEPPTPIPSETPPWGAQPPPVIEFKFTHVEATMQRKRHFVLTNHTNVVAKWKLFHVKAPTKNNNDKYTVREREEQSVDDPTAFKFDIVEGTLCGPSQRSRLLPIGPALPVAWGHEDAELYEPQKVEVTFLPKLARLYRCEFRLQVEGGNPVSFVCMGGGSYDEEDDVMELLEA